LAQEHGWEAIIIPAVEIVPRRGEEILRAVGDLGRYDWIVLTSAFGAEILYDLFGGAMEGLPIAAIGPKTKETLEGKGVSVRLVPPQYKAENLARALKKIGIRGKRILVARASIGREVLVEELRRGGAEVTEVPLYDTPPPREGRGAEELRRRLEARDLDAVIFTSSQTVKNLFQTLGARLADLLEGVKVCAIGPITARTLEERGVRVDIQPEEYTVEACFRALRGS
jgi:uroporphyrinogen III methyltransferase/synthase